MSSHAHGRKSADGRVSKPKPHEMGLQIPCRFHPEVQEEDDLVELRKHLGEVFHTLAAQKESKIIEVT